MKKSLIIYVITPAVFFLSVLVFLLLNFDGGFQDIISLVSVLLFFIFSIFMGQDKIRSINNKEPCEDELSKKITTKASSMSFYISVIFWIALLLISDHTALPTHNLIGSGVIGMSLIFIFSWAGIKFFGLKNE